MTHGFGTSAAIRRQRLFSLNADSPHNGVVDTLTLFGLIAVSLMLAFYALEHRSHWYILGFALACGLGSVYGFLQGAWPFGLVEAVWAIVALQRWRRHRLTAADQANPE